MMRAMIAILALTFPACAVEASGEAPENPESLVRTAAAGCPADTTLVGAGDAAFCVDDKVVSNADYALFLAAPPKDPDVVPACAENELSSPGNDGTVDWCDADAYCRAQGRTLCSPAAEWSKACKLLDTAAWEWTAQCGEDGCVRARGCELGSSHDRRDARGARFRCCQPVGNVKDRRTL